MSSITEQILASLPNSGWKAACISLLPNEYKNSSTDDLALGLVNGYGESVARLDQNAWGINYATCGKYCSPTEIPLVCDPESCKSHRLTKLRYRESHMSTLPHQ